MLVSTPDHDDPLAATDAAAVAEPEASADATARHSHRPSHPFCTAVSDWPSAALAARPTLRSIDSS